MGRKKSPVIMLGFRKPWKMINKKSSIVSEELCHKVKRSRSDWEPASKCNTFYNLHKEHLEIADIPYLRAFWHIGSELLLIIITSTTIIILAIIIKTITIIQAISIAITITLLIAWKQ